MPADLRPMMATLVKKPFSSGDWLFELKFDGIRALAFIQHGKTMLVSRNGNDLTAQYPELRNLADSVQAKDAVLDGEIVVLDEAGRSSFNLLQQRMNLLEAADISRAQKKYPVVYYLFDLPYCDGYRLLRTPLLDRKELLRARLKTSDTVRYSDHIIGDGESLFELARKQELEGIVAKEIHSPYESKRSKSWLKIKTVLQQEAVVVGYTEPQGSRKYFGSLLLALYDPAKKRFYYVGHVGTGFDRQTLKVTFEKLTPLETGRPVVEGGPHRGKAHWVEPQLIAEVRFAQWTPDNRMRVPVFLGLRIDKRPEECVRET